MKTISRNKDGQVTVEYILLLAVVFTIAFLMIRGPMANFTLGIVTGIRGALANVVKHAEWATETITPNDTRHPSNPRKLRPSHL